MLSNTKCESNVTLKIATKLYFVHFATPTHRVFIIKFSGPVFFKQRLLFIYTPGNATIISVA